MSTNEDQNNKFLETLKSNYKQRIKEADNFSRNFSNSSADFRSQYLAGLSDMLQYYLDLQKKLTKGYPLWYDADLMSRQSKLITEAWINTTHNMFSSYSSFLDYGTKNMRVFNQGIIQLMQIAEMFYDMSENVPPIQRNMLVELIKQTKEHNYNFVQKQLPKKRDSSYKGTQKKQVIAK
ncbi:MAG: hypothetical protein HY223_04040 [Thaumarchaeota archaeon]|nr:hypothetical protein [Nitrososphaerota archaeon]